MLQPAHYILTTDHFCKSINWIVDAINKKRWKRYVLSLQLQDMHETQFCDFWIVAEYQLIIFYDKCAQIKCFFESGYWTI